VRSLLADADRRQAFGAAGVERARRLYDWNRIAASTLDVYARVLRGHARRGRADATRFELAPAAQEHLAAIAAALPRLEAESERIASWGERLARRLLDGGRLLALGNGGSAAQAQHLTAELVGRYQTERQPLSAVCLHGDSSSVTAIVNDYGAEEMFARQVRAHGRPGDVLLALSTSGRSPNVLEAARAASELGMETWALCGTAPNLLSELCDEALCVEAPSTATVQELHLVAIHMLCGAVDREVSILQGSSALAPALA
jgi:phosphoheptose isomerase